jgi:2-polyprenyl-3-methyl-5-hydroxy-6-metoxy-1,4-benzoquinol methylase
VGQDEILLRDSTEMRQSIPELKVSQERTDSSQTCSYCGNRTAPAWSGGSFGRCANCGLLIRRDAADTDLNQLYEQSWLHPESCRSETGGTELGHSRIYARELARTLGRSDFKGLTVCDFGAGRGSMAKALAELNAEVYAVEPFGFDFLVSEGIRAYKTLDDLPADLLFDGVVSISVLEHLATPWEELAQLRKRLKPSGWAYMATPNAAGLSARWNGGAWREAARPGHLVLLTPTSIARMFERAGYSRTQRLKWYVAYRPGIRKYLGYILQGLSLDGELRYLAMK